MTTQTTTLANPYEVLDIHPGASAAEITKAFAIATKKRKYPLGAIAKARKQLMNKGDRLLADYLQPILPTPHRFKRSDFSQLDTPQSNLSISPKFDNLDLLSRKNCEQLSQHMGNQHFPTRQSPLESAKPVSISPSKLTSQEQNYVQNFVQEVIQFELQKSQTSAIRRSSLQQADNKSQNLKLLTWSILFTGCSSFAILVASYLLFQVPKSIETYSSPSTLTNQHSDN